MFDDSTKRTARRALGALTAVGLALSLSSGLQAQERTEMADEKQTEITQQELEQALSQPQQELEELNQFQGLKMGHVTVVEASSVLQGEQLATLQQGNAEAIGAFRAGVEGNASVQKALEKHDYALEDVLAVYVTERTRAATSEVAEKPERGEKAEPRTGAHKSVYVVVSGQAAASQPSDSDS